MEMIVLIIHLLVCICLIGLVLLQRSEGGALGMGGGGTGSLMSGRGASDALAKMTSVAGGFFLMTSLSLTFLSGAAASSDGGSVFDNFVPREQSAPVTPSPAPAQPDETPRPDPTESSLPAETQMASAAAPAPVEVAPAAATTTRAASLNATSAPQQPRTTPASSGATQTAARPPASTAQRSAPDTSPASGTPRLVLPSSGAISGVPLTEESLLPRESIEIGNGVEAVRRERAGPDQ
jgi:preprotein translocase subunit SecG